MPSSTPERARETRQLRVVLFSGGRGSGVLTRQLVANPGIALTIAINGYDDGASTERCGDFCATASGPSDFRKNASRLATELRTCPPALVDLLDWRFPAGASEADARAAFAVVAGDPGGEVREVRALADRIDNSTRSRIASALRQFTDLLVETGEPFNFSDCSLGNLVFAGFYLQSGRAFNRAVDEYAALLGLPAV